MKKTSRLQNFGLVLAGAVSASLLWHAFGEAGASSNADTYKQLNLFGDVFDRVRADYVEEPNEGQMIEAAINGMLATLGDENHTAFFSPEEAEQQASSLEGSFEGIGAFVDVLRMCWHCSKQWQGDRNTQVLRFHCCCVPSSRAVRGCRCLQSCRIGIQQDCNG